MLSRENQRRLDNYKAAVKAGEVWVGPLPKKRIRRKARRLARLIDSLLMPLPDEWKATQPEE